MNTTQPSSKELEEIWTIWVAALQPNDEESLRIAGFVDLGGDSLQMIEVTDQIATALDLDFPIEVLLSNGTFSDVLAAVQRLRAPSSSD